MKTISLRELHGATGRWVRKAASLGAVTITDRGRAIARISAVGAQSRENPFRLRKLRPGYAKLRGRLSGGTDSSVAVAEDRERP
jgi:antitoxin (DNA-binding transcriptional repressor) of toxin-antitoxin stability system